VRTLLLGGTDLTQAVAERMLAAGIELAGVVYVPKVFDISYEPGRLHNSRFADLAAWCASAGAPALIYEGPESVTAHAEHCRADFALAAGWYHMIPRSVRARFSRGCAGLHASLLPKFRGGAPLVWAILAGESQAGMSLFELGDGVDDGGLYAQKPFPIGTRTKVGELVAAAEAAAVELVEECLPLIASESLAPRPQQGEPSYGLQRAPRDGRIDWSRPAEDIDRLVRAVGRPYPGAFTSFNNRQVCVWESEPFDGVSIYGTPGQIAMISGKSDPCVVTGSGALLVREATDSKGVSMMSVLRRSGNQRLVS
jgi:methionyl-tRNA formyltransferase